jgi:hypothetical protein
LPRDSVSAGEQAEKRASERLPGLFGFTQLIGRARYVERRQILSSKGAHRRLADRHVDIAIDRSVWIESPELAAAV